MSVDDFMHKWFTNVSSIIEIEIVIFILLMVIVVYFMLRRETKSDSIRQGNEEASLNLKEIEESLKKVLETTRSNPVERTSMTVGESDSNSAALIDEMEELKRALLAKEEEIHVLEKSVSEAMANANGAPVASTGGGSSGDLEEKISELEARLLEYEIIEDDIADLSLFKEENARLRSEVQSLRQQMEAGGSSVQPVTEQPAKVSPQAVENESPFGVSNNESDASGDIFQSVTGMSPATPASDLNVESPEPSVDEADQGTEAGVFTRQDNTSMDVIAAGATDQPSGDMKETAPLAAAPLTAQEEAKPAVSEQSGTPGVDEMDFLALDTDRMLSEIDQLNSIDGSSDAGLDDSKIDTDKMLGEADDLVAEQTIDSADQESQTADNDESALVEEFKSFVKGG